MSIFDEVKAQLHIKDVVNFYGYPVNRAGKFVCPFHNDSHPSASIKNDYFHCFVCGTGGDIITFTARLFHTSNYEAAKRLIADFHLPIKTGGELTPEERLRADRERVRRELARKEREEAAALVKHTGDILAQYHQKAWKGTQQNDINAPDFKWGVDNLPAAEYYLECYDADPEGFSRENRRQVRDIEKRLYSSDNKGQ